MNALALKIKINGCNFNCEYCPQGNRGVGKNDFEQIKEVLRESRSLGLDEVRWSGGEPTIYGKFYDIIHYGKKLGFFQTLSTNGSISGGFSETRRYGIGRVNISLDTLDRDHFKSITKTSLFDTVISNIESAKRQFKLPTKINMVILKGNKHEIPDMLRFARDYGIIIRFMQLTYKKGDHSFVDENRVSIENTKDLIPSFDSYKRYEISKREGRNPVTSYYQKYGQIIGIVEQDFSCMKDKCYKIWFEDNSIKNCKIYKDNSISLKEVDIACALKCSMETKNKSNGNYIHKFRRD